jgi:MFS family permease
MLATGAYIPRLAARFGAVPFILAAVAAGSTITVAYTLTDSPAIWFVLSLLHGAVGGVPWVVTEIWMNVVVEENRRGRVMGVYATMVALGIALGPLVLQVVGLYGPLPFVTAAVLALLVALPLLPYWRSAPAIEHAEDSGYITVVIAAPLAMLAGFVCGLGEQVAFSFLPVYAVGAGVPAEIGALWLSAFVLGNVVLQWPIGWMADHFDRRAVLAGCTLASALLVVLLTAVSAQSLAVVGVVMLWGGVSFAIYPVGLALLGQRFAGGDIARANTAFSLLYISGGLVGRPMTGAAMDAIGDPGLGATLGVFYAAAAIAALLAFRRGR